MDLTLYVDESGAFTRPAEGHLGLRVVGGVVLAGAPGDHAGFIRERLAAAFGWWPHEWHAVELNAWRLMFAVKRMPRGQLPLQLQPVREAMLVSQDAPPHVRRAATDEASRMLGEVRSVVPAALAYARGQLALCVAHNREEAVEGSHYAGMLAGLLRAVVAEVCVEARGRAEGVRLHVHVEQGAAGAGAERLDLAGVVGAACDAWNRAREAGRLRGVASVVPGRVERRPGGRADPGLVLADVVCHQLGPRGGTLVQLGREGARHKTLAERQRLVEQVFGPLVGRVVMAPGPPYDQAWDHWLGLRDDAVAPDAHALACTLESAEHYQRLVSAGGRP